jgi:hypothetical protein
MTERTIKSRIAARTDPRIACRRVFIGVIVAGGPDGDNPRAQDLTVTGDCLAEEPFCIYQPRGRK